VGEGECSVADCERGEESGGETSGCVFSGSNTVSWESCFFRRNGGRGAEDRTHLGRLVKRTRDDAEIMRYAKKKTREVTQIAQEHKEIIFRKSK
jgi:hypothetical protein